MNYLVFKEVQDGAYVIVNNIRRYVNKGHANYAQIHDLAVEYNDTKDVERREAILDSIEDALDTKVLSTFAKNTEFSIDTEGRLYLKGIDKPIPQKLSDYMRKAMEQGITLTPYINFWKNLVLNPDPACIGDLFSFLEHNGHPITKNGYFLAYKAVEVKRRFDKTTGKEVKTIEYNEETGNEVKQPFTQELVYTSIHKGPHGDVIKVGEPVTMPREECDNNPYQTCSHGLHVGSMAYVKDFGLGENSAVLEVLINPRNVVAIPADYNNTKMRVCEYYVLSISNGENSSVYLESDYINYDKLQLEADIKKFEQIKDEAIARLEKELEQRKIAAGLIKI